MQLQRFQLQFFNDLRCQSNLPSNKSAIGARIKVIVENFDGTERNIYATVSFGGSFGASSL